MDKIDLIKEILSYMRANGGPDKSWYVGGFRKNIVYQKTVRTS
jgi:hypothetical protein